MGRAIPAVRANHEVFVAGPSGYPDGQTFVNLYQIDALLSSEGHRRLGGRKWSGGGPFFCYHESKTHGNPGTLPVYIGWPDQPPYVNDVWHPCGISSLGAGYPGTEALLENARNAHAASLADMPRYYASGVAKTRPGRPEASVFQFLWELQELPTRPFSGWLRGVPLRDIPATIFRRLTNLKNLGSEYLNVVFGWKPLVQDIKKMYWCAVGLRKALDKLRRENGRNIRRKAEISQTVSTTGYKVDYPATPFVDVLGPPAGWMSGKTAWSTTRHETKRVWFSAGYRYWIPDVQSWQWTARATAALFGALPTPEALWSILPWSWLIGWFGNVSDVYSNLSVNAVDNLVFNYSYTMCESTVTNEVTAHVKTEKLDNLLYKIPAHEHTYSATHKVVTKARFGGGNPYGLDVSLPDLSAYRLSILAALGLSRSRVTGYR